MIILTTHPGFTIQPGKKGWRIFHAGKRCLDYMKQTGLGKVFATPQEAAAALDKANSFDVYKE